MSVEESTPLHDGDRYQCEVLLSGVGGQGVQLLAKVLALGATFDGLEASLSSDYGTSMRGGSSTASVVVARSSLRALPVVPHFSAALALHKQFWDAQERKLRSGA